MPNTALPYNENGEPALNIYVVPTTTVTALPDVAFDPGDGDCDTTRPSLDGSEIGA